MQLLEKDFWEKRYHDLIHNDAQWTYIIYFIDEGITFGIKLKKETNLKKKLIQKEKHV